MTSSPVLPGSTLGVFGGGQLGRMFASEARRMGYDVWAFTPDQGTPAAPFCSRVVRAAYEDLDAVREFARGVDAITLEFENISAQALEAAAEITPVRPSPAVLHTTQDRLREKRGLESLGLAVAPFAAIEKKADVASAAAKIGFPAILKTSSWGYDGKGQRRVESEAALSEAWTELSEQPCVLEGFIDFELELSIVGARSVTGEVELFEPSANAHERHALDVSVTPAPVSPATIEAAKEIARSVLEGLDVVGVMCVELFAKSSGDLLVNEVAPRPHNSGHLTIEACATSQFGQQLRATSGLPLGSPKRIVPAAAMSNLFGDLWQQGEPDWKAALEHPGVKLHLYGKREARIARKMGHLTATAETPAAAEALVRRARTALVARYAHSTPSASA
ncbi:MAG: 5-(carboxyamino)imidazole ribonucleotide synthase [Planctomycetota bacterium]